MADLIPGASNPDAQGGKRTSRTLAATFGIGAIVAAKFVVKGIIIFAAAFFTRQAAGSIEHYLSTDPYGRATEAGMRSVVPDINSLLAPYKDSSDVWLQTLGTRAVTTSLDVGEQAEFIEGRQLAASSVSPNLCSRVFYEGRGTLTDLDTVLHAIPDSLRSRLGFLSGRAVARALAGMSVTTAPTVTQAEWIEILRRNGSPRQLSEIVAATDSNASPEVRCQAIRTLFTVTLSPPAGSDDRNTAVSYIMHVSATHPSAPQ